MAKGFLEELFEDPWVPYALAGVAGLAWAIADRKTKEEQQKANITYRLKAEGGAANVEYYLEHASRIAQIGNGFVPFGLAVARRESRFNNLAHNDSPSEVQASCTLWEDNSRFVDSPYGRSDFCIGSGGWFGFLPATGLAAKPFRNQNPLLIFDPAASTSMFIAFVEAIIRKYFPKLPPEHRNWLSINRAMASLGTMYDYNETKNRARQNRERLAENLKAIGASPNIMYLKPSVGNYPGAAQVWDHLKDIGQAA